MDFGAGDASRSHGFCVGIFNLFIIVIGFMGPCKDLSPSSSSSSNAWCWLSPLFAELDEVQVGFIMGFRAGFPGFLLPSSKKAMCPSLLLVLNLMVQAQAFNGWKVRDFHQSWVVSGEIFTWRNIWGWESKASTWLQEPEMLLHLHLYFCCCILEDFLIALKHFASIEAIVVDKTSKWWL